MGSLFGVHRAVHMSVLLYVHLKREANCALCSPVTGQSSTPTLTNFVIYPLCFTAYTFYDVMSQLSSLKGEEHQIEKNLDPWNSKRKNIQLLLNLKRI